VSLAEIASEVPLPADVSHVSFRGRTANP